MQFRVIFGGSDYRSPLVTLDLGSEEKLAELSDLLHGLILGCC